MSKDKEQSSFLDYKDAANKLVEILPVKQMQEEKWLLIAMSFKAIPIVNQIAKKTMLDFDLLFTQAVFAPNNDECEIARISEGEEVVIHERLIKSFDINLDFVYAQASRAYEEEILANIYKFRKGASLSSLEKRKVLLIDQGIETGLRAIVNLKTIINKKANFVAIATPVIASEVADDLETMVDELFLYLKIDEFIDVGFYYDEKIQLTPESVLLMLENSPYYLPYKKEN